MSYLFGENIDIKRRYQFTQKEIDAMVDALNKNIPKGRHNIILDKFKNAIVMKKYIKLTKGQAELIVDIMVGHNSINSLIQDLSCEEQEDLLAENIPHFGMILIDGYWYKR